MFWENLLDKTFNSSLPLYRVSSLRLLNLSLYFRLSLIYGSYGWRTSFIKVKSVSWRITSINFITLQTRHKQPSTGNINVCLLFCSFKIKTQTEKLTCDITKRKILFDRQMSFKWICCVFSSDHFYAIVWFFFFFIDRISLRIQFG